MESKRLQDSSDDNNEAHEQVMELNRARITKLGKKVSKVVLPAYSLDNKQLPEDLIKKIFTKDSAYTPVLIAQKEVPAEQRSIAGIKKLPSFKRRTTFIVPESTLEQNIEKDHIRRSVIAKQGQPKEVEHSLPTLKGIQHSRNKSMPRNKSVPTLPSPSRATTETSFSTLADQVKLGVTKT